MLFTIRKQEAEAGWDYGADAVLMRLEELAAAGALGWPADRPLPARSTVNRVFEDDGRLIGLGRAHARKPAITFRTGAFVAVFIDDHLVRSLTIDYNRRYQPISP